MVKLPYRSRLKNRSTGSCYKPGGSRAWFSHLSQCRKFRATVSSAKIAGESCAVPKKNVVSKIVAMTEEELKAEVERLRAENEALKSPARGQLSLKVSEKGAVSVYGLGRFPVTLYKEQWAKLLGMADQIKEFIAKNDHLLKKKE
jgi:hypothetical protein